MESFFFGKLNFFSFFQYTSAAEQEIPTLDFGQIWTGPLPQSKSFKNSLQTKILESTLVFYFKFKNESFPKFQ